MIKTIVPVICIFLGFISAAQAQAPEAYPNKPIRLIVPFPPGGGSDILARLVASKLNERNKWNILVENKPGAGGTVGITEAVKAAPGGYDLVIGQKDNLVIGPWLYKNLKWDPTRDLVAVAHLAYSPVLISTSVGSKYKSLKDVVSAAQKNPGAINYGSPGNGTSIHLAAELFQNVRKPSLAKSHRRPSHQHNNECNGNLFHGILPLCGLAFIVPPHSPESSKKNVACYLFCCVLCLWLVYT